METQINSFFQSKRGTQVVRIFGYSSKGIPGLEVNGVGKLSKNIKEKLIYLTRARKLSTPLRRFVICVDLNDLEETIDWQELKWLEFPILLLYWQLAGLVPISRLDDCLCSGTILSSGEVRQTFVPLDINVPLSYKLTPIERKALKVIISGSKDSGPFWGIDPVLLLQHIPQLKFI